MTERKEVIKPDVAGENEVDDIEPDNSEEPFKTVSHVIVTTMMNLSLNICVIPSN